MRRKSERTATKKAKASPEKKLEKVKRTRTRRRKQSSSSDNESEDGSPVREEQVVVKSDVIEPTPVNENSPEEAQDQVWQVKTAEGLADAGEIQKLKICLTRPPSTPERVDRSPRSKRKHSRATSSSDTPSNEGSEEKKKNRKSKRSRESKDESDKNHDSQGDEPETETDKSIEKSESEVSQSNTFTTQEVDTEDTPMSTTNEDQKLESAQDHQQSTDGSSSKSEAVNKPSDADTTVNSPEGEFTNTSEVITNTPSSKESQPSVRRESVDKSEVLEIHAEDSKIESSEMDRTNKVESTNVEEVDSPRDQDRSSKDVEVSTNNQDKKDKKSKVIQSVQEDTTKNNIKTGVVESSDLVDKERARKSSTDSEKGKDADDSVDRYKDREKRQSESNQSTKEESVQNGQAAPIIVIRKRKWGSRPKLTTQKSITISTDVLKDIIPDVKPIEFNEVIEEKKHKRIEVTEKIERPVLPKIIIDNTENVEHNRMDIEDKEKENVKKDSNLSSGRRISIVKENDNVFARPPSPPRHKQSNILYITNLVRPFTLPQLKNLLQRTGRIIENGFWIDRIKSKCFVKYENEDQAVETRHALHGVTWPVSNPKALQVDFSTEEEYERIKLKEETDGPQTSTIPGTVEDWLREQDIKRERGEVDKPWDRRATMREWDVGKNEKEKEKDKLRREERPNDKRRHRSQERSPEPVKKFKLKEEAPAKLLDDLFRKTKATPCIYWLPHSAETIAIKEELRRQQLAEHERRMQELRARQHQHRRH